ncbi:MAG: ATP-binding region ATPase domain protein [Anaerolineaceae bacterium]|nr:MAG: ATP-binding region ATPase domain protein [Anaerolineaceae bacterium]
MAKQNKRFTFDISLSVLNHLGRNLYRSFVTVLGEAISNAWDADAENVWIYINKENNSFTIKDDGKGMTAEDFQDKFLKIGYSKRKSGSKSAEKGRPFIGRKGIGKLALLSCAETVTVLSRIEGGEYEGGVIDNSDLDQAIKDDLSSRQYQLGLVQYSKVEHLTNNHNHGTIIYFENIRDGIRKSIEHLRKLIALYFRFSLLDESFNIWLDDKLITFEDLEGLAKSTQFVWVINKIDDPYIASLQNVKKKHKKNIPSHLPIKGFIASVEKPGNLKITSTEEKAGIDLLVNGRLRERDILKHIPTARIVENYLYGQIHFNALDEETKDRFTSSREGIIADDEKFLELLDDLKNSLLPEIINDWDVWRVEIGREGDDDNLRISPKARKSRALFNVVSQEYSMPEDSDTKDKVGQWVNELAGDAEFNFSAYAECFVSENLVRKYIEDKQISLSEEAEKEKDKWKNAEIYNKNKANISIEIRRSNSDLSYLSMDGLANLIDKTREPLKEAALSRDATEYKPMRDALAHTALLTDLAKSRLTAVYENIKARVRTLLSNP